MADIFMEYSKDDIDQKFLDLATPENISNINTQLADIATLIEGNDGDDITSQLQNALNNNGKVKVFSRTPKTFIVSNTLLIKDNTIIEVSDCLTIKKANNINKAMIKNADTVNGNKNITFIGGIYDFNASNNTNYDGHGFIFNNVKNLKYFNLTLQNENKYCSLVCNIDGFIANNITFNNNSDGLHFQPPGNNIVIKNLKGFTNDDMISFTIGDYASYQLTNAGNFTNIYIDGVFPSGAASILKLTGSGQNSAYKFRNISLNNVYGSVTQQVIAAINDGSNLVNTVVDSIDVNNIYVTGAVNGVFYLGGTIHNVNLNNIKFATNSYYIRCVGTIDNLEINNVSMVSPNDIGASVSFLYNDTGSIITNLLIQNISVALTKSGAKFIDNRGTISETLFNNVRAVGGTDAIFINTISGSIFTDIFFNNVKVDSFTYFLIMLCPITINATNSILNGQFWMQASQNLRVVGENCPFSINIYKQYGGAISLNSSTIKFNQVLANLTPQQYDRVICISTDEPTTTRGYDIYNGTSWVKLA